MTARASSAPPFPFPDSGGRSFADLSDAERARLAGSLRPLAWIDGLIAAAVVAPEEPEDWIDHVWADGELGNSTPAQAHDVEAVVMDHYGHVVDALYDKPETYRPYLAGIGDELQIAGQWAAGFRFAIRLEPEPWAPLINDRAARTLMAAIFCLEQDETLSEKERAEFPFRDLPAERLKEMRRTAVGDLRDVVHGLNEFSLALGSDAIGGYGKPAAVRATRKIGRNEPCPCGSGKKYKKCCLSRAGQLG